MKKTAVILFLLIGHFLTGVGGAEDTDSVSPGSEALFDAVSFGRYGEAWTLLQELLSSGSPEERDFSPSQLATFFTAHALSRALSGKVGGKSEDYPEGLRTTEAIGFIVEQARERRIVILNEEHDNSQSRAFALELLRALHEEGFTVLAAETFTDGIGEEAYVSCNSGWYTRDPFFADFVREAMRLGFKLVPYESRSLDPPGTLPSDSINRREAEQSEHLFQRTIERYPQEKVFLYVGYSHLSENPVAIRNTPDGREVEVRWMACRLKDLTGIDPLTIDQTTLTERGEPGDEHPAYRELAKSISRPGVLLDAEETPQVVGPYRGQADIQVVHPRSMYLRGRADWMRMGGYRKEVPVLREWVLPDSDTVLEAYLVDEPLDDALAVDRVVVSAESRESDLLLPEGTYLIRRQLPDGSFEDLWRVESPQRDR